MQENAAKAATDSPTAPTPLTEPGPVGSPARRTSGGGWRILRTRWWLVVSCVAAVMAMAAMYLRVATRIYTSTAMIVVEQNTPNVALDGVEHATRFDSYLYTQAELIRTTSILADALKQPDVRRCRTLLGAADPVATLQGLLDCTVGKRNDIISMSLRSPYPDEAARLLNHVVRAYLDYNSRNTRDTASEILKILKEARQTATTELSQAMAKVLDFRRAHGVLSLDNGKGNVIAQRLATLSDELTKAELDRIQAQVSFESMAALREDPAKARELFRSLESGASSFAQDRAKLAEILSEAEVRHAGLRQRYASDHPTVLEAGAECEAARAQLQRHDEQQLDAIIVVVEQQYRAAEKRESELKTAMSTQRDLTMDFNAKAVEYAMLESDLKRKENLCDILDGRIKEIDIRGDSGGLNIAVMEWGKVASCPSQPDRTRIIAIALILGLALGIGVATGVEWLDDRVRSSADLPESLKSCFLGEVPFRRRLAAFRRSGRPNREAIGHLIGDEYDEIRSLLCAPRSRGKGGTILLTSSMKGEGRTVAACGLAVAMARSGTRTLVVDGDFLNPRQHEMFGLRQRPGLSELLSGEATLASAIQSTATPHLDLLSSGSSPAAIPQAVRRGISVPLLDLLALTYDCIIVDAPPALASPDVRELAAGCDKTVLVLRARQSACGAADRVRHALQRAGASVAGVLLHAR